ncbi:MAG: hypothetical protein LBJ60_09415 [Tannerellaceae bacterium]|jgi:hypothetical protein|nr:hypothetical protein [Tannerellaceae bacterium]
MKKNFVLMLTAFCALSLSSHSQIKSGLVVGAGLGNIRANINTATLKNTNFREINGRSNVSVGYRFRFLSLTDSPLFFDLDANAGLKFWHSAYRRSYREPAIYEASSKYYFVSLNGMAAYPLYKGLHIGAGVEPTYYFRQEGESSKNAFDIPLVGRIAYDFKLFEVGLSYKHGLMNVIKTDRISSGKFRDWRLSVWIPF